MWFFSADWHLGHANIVKYCKRPFLSREEEGLLAMIDRGTIPARDLRISPETTNRMTDTIIDSTNAVVAPDDSLVLIGDFCWTPRDDRFAVAKKFRDRINCKNMFLIWGNHDDRRFLSPTMEIVANDGKKYRMPDEAKALFKVCYDQYVFSVDGQHIFCSHYPCRSWDMAHHGSWDLYGHVHDLYGPEDNGDLMPYQKKVFTEGFQSVLERHGLIGAAARMDDVVNDLLAVCSSLNGIDLTVDVGVDNRIRGEAIPFGTPWSMTDLRAYMGKKKSRWDARSDGYRNLRPASSLKGGNPNADPKF